MLLDNTGNTLNNGLWSYTYSPHNRLDTATENATLKATFQYNGLGQRFHKTDSQSNTGHQYLYGQNGELLVETDQDGNILQEHLYLNGQPLAVFYPDDDQDGQTNKEEATQGTLPANTDQDGDGLTNSDEWFIHGTDSANADSDGDGVYDNVEISQGTDPNDPNSGAQLGDVNGDGQINVGDLVVLTRIVMGLHTPTPGEITRGDMNQDTQLNAADILLLQKLLLSQAFNQLWLDNPANENQATRVASTAPHIRLLTQQQRWFETLFKTAEAVPSTHGELNYVHNDHLGTPQTLTNEAGTVVWSAEYDPFGKATINEDPDNDGNSVTFNLRFPGQYEDVETVLYYNLNRYYSPGTGRYLTSDPIGLDGGLNTYLYVSANPLRNVDPSGLVDWEGTQVSVGAAIGVGASFTRLNLSSKCINGKKATATIWAVGPSIGIGAGATSPVSGSTNVAFEDILSTPDPNVFNGIYSGYYIGVDYGPGRLGLEITVLGRAHAVGPTLSYGFGIAAGYIYTFGSSTVINSSIENCCNK